MKRFLIGGLLGLLIASFVAGCENPLEIEENSTEKKEELVINGKVVEVKRNGAAVYYTLDDQAMYGSDKFVYFVIEGDNNQYKIGQRLQIYITYYENDMIKIMESNPPQIEIERIKIM